MTLAPSAQEALALGPGEQIVNHWAYGFIGGGVAVLTNQRLVLLSGHGVVKKRYDVATSRNLESLAEPAVKGDDTMVMLVVAGESLEMENSMAHAARDDIAQTRAIRIASLGPNPGGVQPSPEVVREREIVTREIVRVPCRYCGQLMDQTATRCPACSAPVK